MRVQNPDLINVLKPKYHNGNGLPHSGMAPLSMTDLVARRFIKEGFGDYFCLADRKDSSNPNERIKEMGGYKVGDIFYRKQNLQSKNLNTYQYRLVMFIEKTQEAVIRPAYAKGDFVEKFKVTDLESVFQVECPEIPTKPVKESPKKVPGKSKKQDPKNDID